MQTKLFDKQAEGKSRHREWRDMPEFVQEKQDCHGKITVRFESEKDMQDFAKLVGQKLTKKTKSIWYPAKSHWGTDIYRWVDEDEP